MIPYLELVEDVLTHGKFKQGPQSVDALTVVGRQAHYDLTDGFPLITTRDLSRSWRAIRAELLWIMSGSTNAFDLHQYNVKLWDQWATPKTSGKLGLTNGDLGPIYGHQLRNFNYGFDQLTQTRNMLIRNPDTRRAVISFWNPADVEVDGVERVFIAPCITQLNFDHLEGQLHLHVTQRSADVPVGVPFDIAEYALLLMLMAHDTGLVPGHLIHSMTDVHIYRDQIQAMKELLTRQPKSRPSVTIANSPSGTLFDHRLEDFQLSNYNPHPPIKIPVAT